MKKKVKVTFKRGTSSESYIVESITNAGFIAVSPSRFARVGDRVSATEVDYVCEHSRSEVLVKNN